MRRSNPIKPASAIVWAVSSLAVAAKNGVVLDFYMVVYFPPSSGPERHFILADEQVCVLQNGNERRHLGSSLLLVVQSRDLPTWSSVTFDMICHHLFS
jgi:hypothetical protein